MGNAIVNNRNVALSIVLDNAQGFFCAGVPISGRAMMQVSDVVVAQMLSIQVVGQESTVVSYTTSSSNSDGSSSTTTHTAYGKFVFLNLTQTVSFADRQNQLFPGQYEFPFSFVVPLGYPISMAAGAADRCEFSYRVEVTLQNSAGGHLFTSSNVAQQVLPFSLLPSSTFAMTNAVPAYVPPTTIPSRSFCCVGRGCMTVGMFTPSAFLYGGDSVPVSYILRNNSHVDIVAIEFTVRESIRWEAEGHVASASTNLFHLRLPKENIQFDVTSLKKQQQQPSFSNKSRVRSGEYIEDSATLTELKATLDSMKYTIQSTIFNNPRMTFTGKLIKVQHELIMKVITPFGTNNPTLTVPLIIQPRPMLTVVPSLTAAQLAQTGQLPCNPNVSAAIAHDWHPSVVTQVGDLTSASVACSTGLADAVVVRVLSSPLLVDPSFSVFAPSLRGSFAPLNDLKDWLCSSSSAGDSLTPIDFKLLYEIVEAVLDQLAMTDVLVEKRKDISCMHMASALMSCSSLVSVQLAQKMVVKCHDKENFSVIEQQMSPFDWLSVKGCFN
jgi:hypothetical protein